MGLSGTFDRFPELSEPGLYSRVIKPKLANPPCPTEMNPVQPNLAESMTEPTAQAADMPADMQAPAAGVGVPMLSGAEITIQALIDEGQWTARADLAADPRAHVRARVRVALLGPLEHLRGRGARQNRRGVCAAAALACAHMGTTPTALAHEHSEKNEKMEKSFLFIISEQEQVARVKKAFVQLVKLCGGKVSSF